jgi:hypothetical protein
VVALLIWMGCVIRRRVIDEEYRQYRIEQEESMTQYVVQRPLPTYWRFPRSITPPLVPTYTARPLPRRYTANRVAQDGTTSYIFWDDQGRT